MLGSVTRRLALARIATGAIFLVRTTPLASMLGASFASPRWLGAPDAGWHPTAFGPVLPAALAIALVAVRTLAALAFLLGVRSRPAGLVAALLGYAALSQDPLAYVNSLHLLFLCTLTLALSDSSAELALARVPAASVRSGVWLVRSVALSVYFFSGVAKCHASFLSGATLVALRARGEIRGILGDWVCSTLPRARAASLGVAAVELALPALLVCRKTRWLALGLAFAFHAALEVSMHPDVFGWLMVALLVTFASNKKPYSNE